MMEFASSWLMIAAVVIVFIGLLVSAFIKDSDIAIFKVLPTTLGIAGICFIAGIFAMCLGG